MTAHSRVHEPLTAGVSGEIVEEGDHKLAILRKTGRMTTR